MHPRKNKEMVDIIVTYKAEIEKGTIKSLKDVIRRLEEGELNIIEMCSCGEPTIVIKDKQGKILAEQSDD